VINIFQILPGLVGRDSMLTFSRKELLEQPVAMKKSLIFVLAIALLAFSLLLGGCSTVSMVYRNADWYLQHEINGYTSFNAQQEKLIRQDVSDYMKWHRKNALPEYIIFLQNLNGAAQYEGRLEIENATLLRAQLINLYRITLAPAITPAARILSTLDSRQIQELDRNFARQSQKQKNEELKAGADELLDRRADNTLSFVEWLAGNLSKEQEQKVREMSRHLPAVRDIYMQNRAANQNRLIALLNDHAGEEKIAAFLSTWLFTPEATRTPQQQLALQSFEQASDEMIIQIHGLLTAAQKEHIHKMISSYIDDLRAEIGRSRQDPSK
jgi:hypothetical protein